MFFIKRPDLHHKTIIIIFSSSFCCCYIKHIDTESSHLSRWTSFNMKIKRLPQVPFMRLFLSEQSYSCLSTVTCAELKVKSNQQIWSFLIFCFSFPSRIRNVSWCSDKTRHTKTSTSGNMETVTSTFHHCQRIGLDLDLMQSTDYLGFSFVRISTLFWQSLQIPSIDSCKWNSFC